MTRLHLTARIALALATLTLGACKKDDCAKAEGIYLEQAKKRAALAVGGVTDPAAKAEAQKASDAELAAAGSKFVAVCQELGPATVLGCVEQALAQVEKPELGLELTADCKALGDQLQAKLYGNQ